MLRSKRAFLAIRFLYGAGYYSYVVPLAQTGFFPLAIVKLLSRQGGQGGRFARNDNFGQFLDGHY
jgi:hypothetical protein